MAKRMKEVVLVRKDEEGRHFIDLPASITRQLSLRIGSWVEVSVGKGCLYVRKAVMHRINVTLPKELIDGIREFQREEGYYSEEEAATNLLVKGLAEHLWMSEDEKDRKYAAELENKWYLKVHPAKNGN